MKFYFIVISLLSLSWSFTAQNSEENKNTTQENVQATDVLTTLDLLDYIEVNRYRFTFKSALNDGRCPKDVTCVWAGEAEILIEINDGSETVSKKIKMPALGFEKEILSTQSHKVYLKNLVPYPMKAIDKTEAYQLLIKIQSLKS